MSMLRSAIDELRLVDPDDLTLGEVSSELVELTRAASSLDAARMRLLASFDRRGGYELDGYLSATSWLKDRCRLPGGTASSQVRVAKALARMPATAAAYCDGDITYPAVRALTDAYRAHPEVFIEHEETLIDAARSLGARPLRMAVDYWRQAIDEASALDDTNRRYEARRLHVSATLGGMVRLDGDFDPEGGEVVMTALGSVTDREARATGDKRTPAQRRSDALVEICRQWLDHGDTGLVGGEKPHLFVTVDLEVLERRAKGRSETQNGQVLHPETVRRLACDAGVSRIVTQGGSEPLDVGRSTRTVPSGLRRAVVVRDLHCTFPGCDRPQRWCDAHHIVHWAKGGETRLDNLTLLCRRHHRLIHEGGCSLERGPDGPVFKCPGVEGPDWRPRRPDP